MNKSLNEELEDSIVVLGTSPGDSLFLNSFHHNNSASTDFQDMEIINMNGETNGFPSTEPNDQAPMESMVIASNIIASCSLNEIQQKLVNLLDENNILKDTLKQNNASIKEQFNTIVSWREDVMKTYSLHRNKFNETKSLIEKLKKENDQQRSELEKMKSFVLSQYSNDDSHKSYEKLVDDSQIDLLTSHVQTLEKQKREILHDNEELGRQNESLQSIIKSNESHLQDMQCRLNTTESNENAMKENVKSLERRVSILQEELKNAQFKLSEFETIKLEHSQYKQNNQNCIRHLKIEIQELKSKLKDAYIMTLQPVKFSLNLEECRDNESYKKICQNAEIYDKIVKDLTSDLNTYINQFFTLYENCTIIANSLQNKIPDAGYEQIKKDLNTLTKNADAHLKSMAQHNQTLKTHLSGFENIFHEFKELLDTMKANKVQLNECTAKLITKKEEVDVCKEELENLRKLASTIQKDSEQMDLLKAQIEVYKNDFEAERLARTDIAAEKQVLVEQLRALHLSRQPLIDEVESLRHSVSIPGSSMNSETTYQGSPRQTFIEVHTCPICNAFFEQSERLQDHVYSCLDRNGL